MKAQELKRGYKVMVSSKTWWKIDGVSQFTDFVSVKFVDGYSIRMANDAVVIGKAG